MELDGCTDGTVPTPGTSFAGRKFVVDSMVIVKGKSKLFEMVRA
jgi:hypothetical protein